MLAGQAGSLLGNARPGAINFRRLNILDQRRLPAARARVSCRRQKCSTENKAVIIFSRRMAQQAEVQEEFEVVEEIPDQSYASFLNSKRWKEIRELVLRRCNRVCEACGHREAIIAHHTTYAFGKVPPLWTLKGICRSCHARFTRRFAGGDHRARRDDWLGKNGRS